MTKLGKLPAAVIDGGAINRPEHPVRHIGRTRDLEKMSSGEMGGEFAVHSSLFSVSGLRALMARLSLMADLAVSFEWDLGD